MRNQVLDGLRGFAILSMFIAHTAPDDAVGRFGLWSEYLTAPLFVALIGFGSQLAFEKGKISTTNLLVRVIVLAVLGRLLMQIPGRVSIVLVWLAAMTLIAHWLVRWSNRSLLLLAIAGFIVAPLLFLAIQNWVSQVSYQQLLGKLLWYFGGHPNYRVVDLLVFLVIGIWLARSRERFAGLLGAGGLALAASLVLFVGGTMLAHRNIPANPVHRLSPYNGSYLTQLVSICLVFAVIILGWYLLERVPSVLIWLSSLGLVALSVYVIHVLILAERVRLTGELAGWPILFGLVVGSLVLAKLWVTFVPGIFKHGPIEGLLRWGSSLPDHTLEK